MKITELLDRPIAYHRCFVTLTGSVKAAVMLSQAVYWQPRAKQADGYWYKTIEEWQEETGLTDHEQRTARRDCAKYLLSDLRGVPAQLYYKVDEEALEADLLPQNVRTSSAESAEQVGHKPQNIKRNAENTTENMVPSQDKKKDLVDFVIDYQIHPAQIREAIGKYFKLTPNWEAKYNRQFMEWAVGIEMTAEQVQSASELWRSDKRFNWSVPTLKGIQEHWLELIEKEEEYTGGKKSHAL